jgi:hypothetical protein
MKSNDGSTHSSQPKASSRALDSLLGQCHTWYHETGRSILPILVSMFTLLIINVIFIADIELALRRNREQAVLDGDETAWSFGQILSMLLVVLPIRDLVETLLARREKRHEKKLIQAHTVSLQEVIRSEAVGHIEDLINQGADVNTQVKGTIMLR